MARKDEAAAHLMAGKSLRQISSEMGITLQSVAQYLYTKVGEGKVKRSDILFSIDSSTRRLIEDLIQQLGRVDSNSIYGAARRQGHRLSYDELAIYLKLRDARVSLGDMYELICRIETELHAAIKITLVEEYGPSEKGRWRQVPKEVRQWCQQMREDDGEPAAEPFCYTTFVQLSKILDKQWSVFVKVLPIRVAKDKKKLIRALDRLNGIRNYVMHPVKGMPLTENDFVYVREFSKHMRPSEWRFPGASIK